MKKMEENEQIKNEYQIWKRNTPFLYEFQVTHALEWPSPTVQWLPITHKVNSVILGTHSECERNYLIIAKLQLPLDPPDAKQDHNDPTIVHPKAVKVVQQINHEGKVNRARYMPQNPFFIATNSVSGEVYVFHYNRHPKKAQSEGIGDPDLRLKGHTSEGFGLSWNHFRNGVVLSGSQDSQIRLWDINTAPKNSRAVQAMQIFTVPEGPVHDVAWNLKNEHLFGSVGSGHYMLLWDIRTPNTPVNSVATDPGEARCLAFNPMNETLFATGSADTTVKLFDTRKIGSALHTFRFHKDQISQVGWDPEREFILTSSCNARRVAIWDLSRIGEEQSSEDAEDGPPELLFIHGGHTGKVMDFSWNLAEDGVIASVDDTGLLQIWKMAEHIAEDDDPPKDEN